jgi:hypothetical protein
MNVFKFSSNNLFANCSYFSLFALPVQCQPAIEARSSCFPVRRWRLSKNAQRALRAEAWSIHRAALCFERAFSQAAAKTPARNFFSVTQLMELRRVAGQWLMCVTAALHIVQIS